MKGLLSILLVLSLLGAAVPAQTTKVVPAMYAGLEAPGHSLAPFYFETVRCQVLYRSRSLARTNGLLTGLQFRRDGIYRVPFSACTRDIRIDFYQTPVSPAGMTTTFATNRGKGAPATLFSQKVNLPTLPLPAATPASWAVKFPFPQPQPFSVSSGEVLLEFIHRGPGTGTNRYFMDGEFLPRTPSGRSTQIGMYCTGANGEAFKSSPDVATWILGGKAQVSWSPRSSQPSSILAFIGSRRDRWGSLKLPFDLGPLGGTSASMDPCRIHTDLLAGQVVGRNRKASFGPIPRNPALVDMTLYTQGVGPAPKANALGIVTGPAFQVILGSDQAPTPDVNMMYARNSLTATTGVLDGGSTSCKGPVARFTGVFN